MEKIFAAKPYFFEGGIFAQVEGKKGIRGKNRGALGKIFIVPLENFDEYTINIQKFT